MIDYGLRYDAKRASGISEFRSDGSRTNRETDVHGGAAEQFAAEFFGASVNTEIYSNHGDGGEDFRLGNLTVDVVHMGMVGNKPRMTGNLIINPHEPWRWADIYVLVRGCIDTGFEILGWYPHTRLVKRPTRNFGYGGRYWCPIEDLYPVEPLIEAISEGS